jgi:endothelin-converting enzyme
VLAHDVVEFEKLLAAASPNAEDRNDVTKYYNPLSLKDATMLAPEVNLAKIINNLAPADVKTSRVIVKSPQYLRDLSKILSNTSRDILQTYFIWKVIQNYASVVEAEEIKPYSRVSKLT